MFWRTIGMTIILKKKMKGIHRLICILQFSTKINAWSFYFVLAAPQTNIDECGPVNPCQNGATCTDGVNMYTCSCASGWTGHNCQVSMHEFQHAHEVCKASRPIFTARASCCFFYTKEDIHAHNQEMRGYVWKEVPRRSLSMNFVNGQWTDQRNCCDW